MLPLKDGDYGMRAIISIVIPTWMTKRASLAGLINLFFIQSVLYSEKVTFVLGKRVAMNLSCIYDSEYVARRCRRCGTCLIESIVDVEYRLIHLLDAMIDSKKH